MNLKYVMFTDEKTGLKAPVFCSDLMNHCDMRGGKGLFPTSAGTFNLVTMEASGASESLGLKSMPDDTEVCKMAIGGVLHTMGFLHQDVEHNKACLHKLKSEWDRLGFRFVNVMDSDDLDAIQVLAAEYGFKRCEIGYNLDIAIINLKKLLKGGGLK